MKQLSKSYMLRTFQFQKVRLKLHNIYFQTGYELISIPEGSIKALPSVRFIVRKSVISIPEGSIKALHGATFTADKVVFQFQKVRLKHSALDLKPLCLLISIPEGSIKAAHLRRLAMN